MNGNEEVVCINMLFVLDSVRSVTLEWFGTKVVALKVFLSTSSNMQPRSCLVLMYKRLCTRHSGETHGLILDVKIVRNICIAYKSMRCVIVLFFRNRDFQEVALERDGETLLQFAAVYGFRNIQTLVHRMRKGKVPYQLVEVLSCPGGIK